MRLSSVGVHGYARFKDATCNVDGRVIAFVGPNEAGKSSLLQALRWLTDPTSGALAPHLLNRDAPPSGEDPIVEAKFILTADELELIRELDLDTAEDRSAIDSMILTFSKRPDGVSRIDCDPILSRNPSPFVEARRLMTDASRLMDIDSYGEEFAEEFQSIEPHLDHNDILDDASLQILRTGAANLQSLLRKMSGDSPEGEAEPDQVALFAAVSALELAIVSGSKSKPTKAIRALLAPLVPQFVLFNEADRELPAVFDVNAEVATPNALRNLLAVGGASIDEVRRSLSGLSGYRTLEGQINERLGKIDAFWSQSEMRPHVGISPNGLLDTTINDAEGFTAINERSEGLRAFLALTCFLITTQRDVPPILLIDEAERNLHYDAQGDLVRLLTNELPVDQVIYTTHSPGCLPLDLGNGIRVVARSKLEPKESELHSNFWTDEEPGFSRLLFAMGAKAAAFSAFNKALLTEGPSEMILLPSLLRAASPSRTIDFQVAFGLSGMSLPGDLGAVALLTSYLVDGDASGDKMLADLEDAGVPEANRLQLPKGQSIEDLLDRDFYLDAVDAVLSDSKRKVLVDRAALDSSKTVAKAVDLLEKSVKGFKAPGHKIVASRITRNPDAILLSEAGRAFLANELWPKLELAFEKPYTVG